MFKRLLLTLALLVSLTLPGAQAQTTQDLDIEGWLSRPGVRLLAVEFYATWCKPCMKAVPDWKKLHERYADQGLRLIVVATRDPRGQCKNPGWNPDDIVCDTDGRIADALGVGESLPSAFLWSWRGDLLVRKGHVKEVAQAVDRELLSLPRLIIEPPKGAQKKALQGVIPFVQTELVRTDKVSVVAGIEAQQALAEARKLSREPNFSDRTRCKPGEALAANSVLRLDLPKVSAKHHLSLQLYNRDTGCLSASALSRWNARRPHVSVAEAVSELIGALRVPFEAPLKTVLPNNSTQPSRPEASVKVIPTRADEWAPAKDEMMLTVKFDSDPAGARVTVDDEELCKATPCRREVPLGTHEVTMTLGRYETRTRQVTFEQGRNVSWSLQPTFGTVTISSEPSNVAVSVNGEVVGHTPLTNLELAEGDHTILVEDHCNQRQVRQVALPRGKSLTLNVQLTPRPAGLKVNAADEMGDVVTGTVYLDGVKLGTTGKTYKVPVCAQRVEVRHEMYGIWRSDLSLRLNQTLQLTAGLVDRDKASVTEGLQFLRVEPGVYTMGSASTEEGHSSDEKPARRINISRAFEIKSTEVTQAEWKRFMGTAPAKFSTCGDTCPVEHVSWWDALAFANALSEREGLSPCYELEDCVGMPGDGDYRCQGVAVSARLDTNARRFEGQTALTWGMQAQARPIQATACEGYRLPTEAEWEYAARAGTSEPRYGAMDDIAWSRGNSDKKPNVVGQKKPNSWGLYDMLGNVWEWTWDTKAEYASTWSIDPAHSSSNPGAERVFRGCGWTSNAKSCRFAERSGAAPFYRASTLGFRPARTLFD